MNWIRVGVINIVVLIGILLTIELISAAFYFYKSATVNNTFSTVWLVKGIAGKIDRFIARSSIEGGELPRYNADSILIYPKNPTEEAFGKYLFREYEKEFSALSNKLKKSGIPLWIFWLPTNKSADINNFYLQYFETLATKYKLKFISGKELLGTSREYIFLEPYNGHLTRYANLLISDLLSSELKKEKVVKKNSFKCTNIRGMFGVNKNELWPIIPEVPYLMTTDEFGFRSSLPEQRASKEKPTILIAGDSFTFGPHLSSYDTYPAHLARKLNSFNIINGGVFSFSLRSERALIEQNLKCLNPNIVILQVLDNDIPGMAVAKYNGFNFKGEVLKIPDVEKKFYESLR